MKGIGTILKQWMLPVAMVTGALSYIIYDMMPASVHAAGPFLNGLVAVLQPLMIFAMLFLTFIRIEPKDLKPHRWHWWLLLIQGGLFTLLSLLAYWVMERFPDNSAGWVVLLESAMLCFITPTATAAAVVTRKLNGDVPGITTYIVLINILTALLVPLMLPLICPSADTDFWTSFGLIMSKVFPLLIAPCLCAWLVRYMFPQLYRRLLQYPDLAFYIWGLALTLAIAVTVKSIMQSDMAPGLLLAMSAVSLVCCIFQFAAGRIVGSRYVPRSRVPLDSKAVLRGREVRKVTAGQSLGQKNTIFSIWLAYTFMTPETAIIGGLYSIWHNLYNSWQLYRAGKKQDPLPLRYQ